MTPPLRPRISLFSKIIGGFLGIILVMIGFSIVILMQLKPLFSPNQTEFGLLPLSLSIENTLQTENEAIVKYLTSRDPTHEKMMLLVMNRFNNECDSLNNLTNRSDMRVLVEEIAKFHRMIQECVQSQGPLVKQNLETDPLIAFQHCQPLSDSIQSRLHTINDASLPSLSRGLKRLEKQMSGAIGTAYIVLILSLSVALAAAVIIARTLSKPIQALKAGTEKVGEGHFETVAVTTNDEVADLTLAFNLMSDKLKQLDEMRMQMMSEISHEMRTPLQVIKAGCYSIVHAKNSAELSQRQREALAMITQATNRINSFVNLFLDVAKMEAGLMKFHFEDVDLSELLTPLVQEAQLIAQTRQINVEFNLDKIPHLSLDKERVIQVFSNLLSNALKYTPDNGTITVEATQIEQCEGVAKNGTGCIKVDIKDSGVGIPEEDLSKLFNKFYQTKNVPLVNEKGSGLGLALVKHVTEAHGGRVSVQSKVGVGSTFSVLLPA